MLLFSSTRSGTNYDSPHFGCYSLFLKKRNSHNQKKMSAPPHVSDCVQQSWQITTMWNEELNRLEEENKKPIIFGLTSQPMMARMVELMGQPASTLNDFIYTEEGLKISHELIALIRQGMKFLWDNGLLYTMEAQCLYQRGESLINSFGKIVELQTTLVLFRDSMQ